MELIFIGDIQSDESEMEADEYDAANIGYSDDEIEDAPDIAGKDFPLLSKIALQIIFCVFLSFLIQVTVI